ncbi:MAG TPA: FxsA family protein [Pilimelia sp.]|nr:FxsA family protein [Pilimelia sp.]
MRRLVGVFAGAGVALAVAEFTVFAVLVRQWGPVWPLLVSLATSAVGLWLARREGVRAWRSVAGHLSAGQPPGRAAVAGVVALAGACLIALPGLVGDVLGLLLWAPPSRRVAAAFAAARPGRLVGLFGPRRVRVRTGRGAPPGQPRPGGAWEGEVVER